MNKERKKRRKEGRERKKEKEKERKKKVHSRIEKLETMSLVDMTIIDLEKVGAAEICLKHNKTQEVEKFANSSR
jgi:hypothetical protein